MRLVCFSFFLVLFFAVGHKGLHVFGPPGPVLAQLGGSVLLPCLIESPLTLEGLQVEWRQMGSNSLVSLLQQGKSRPDLQSQVFRDRADFFLDEVSKGNFSILLKNVFEEDAGVYRCQVNTTQDSSEVIMEVKNIKHFVVTGADQAVFAYEGGDAILNCSVDSHLPVSEIEEVTWKKRDGDQDILVLLYQDGTIFPDASHESFQGRVDLFLSEIPKGNFSLKLVNVKMEDKGQFVCEVYTRHTSAQTIVLLQGVGFSALHIAILLLCVAVVLMAVGFCGPVLMLLKRKDYSKKAIKKQFSLILCPNIFLFITFCLWIQEGFLSEVISCSAVNILRPVLLLKACFFLDILPTCLQKPVKSLAVPLYHSAITLTACSTFFESLSQVQIESGYIVTLLAVIVVVIVISAAVLAVYGLRIHLTVCLEIFNLALLGILLSKSNSNFDYSFEIPSVITPQITGMMLALSLQRHLFQEKPFGCVHITLSSIIVTLLSISKICVYILLSITVKDFAKDRSGYMALMVLVHVLTATCLFKHSKHLPDFVHIMVYMFGAVGLSTINAIVLATELILKAGKGARTIEDLRVIVVPLETVFLFAWLTLQIWDAWIQVKDRTNHHCKDERESGPEGTPLENVVPEMEVLSDPNPNPNPV